MAVVGFTRGMQIVNTSSGETSQQLVCPCSDVDAVAFSPDGGRLAAAGRNGRIRVWTVSSGARERDIETDRRRIRSLTFSPDGKRLAAAGDGTTVRVFDVTTGSVAATIEARPARVYALQFLANDSLATGGTDNRVWIWDLNTAQATRQLEGHTGTVAALACDAHGTTLVSGGYDTTLRIWNLAAETEPSVAQTSAESVR